MVGMMKKEKKYSGIFSVDDVGINTFMLEYRRKVRLLNYELHKLKEDKEEYKKLLTEEQAQSLEKEIQVSSKFTFFIGDFNSYKLKLSLENEEIC